ncbi:MAG: hypothetical protein AAF310_03705 [Myxococcota bacterium]
MEARKIQILFVAAMLPIFFGCKKPAATAVDNPQPSQAPPVIKQPSAPKPLLPAQPVAVANKQKNQQQSQQDSSDCDPDPVPVDDKHGNMIIEEEGGGGHCGFFTATAMRLNKEKPSLAQQQATRNMTGRAILAVADVAALKAAVLSRQIEGDSKQYYDGIDTTQLDADFLDQLAQRIENRDPTKPNLVYQLDELSIAYLQQALNYRILIINQLDLSKNEVKCEYVGALDADPLVPAATHVGIGWGGTGHFQLLAHKDPDNEKMTRKFKVGDKWPPEVQMIVKECYKERRKPLPAAWGRSLR